MPSGIEIDSQLEEAALALEERMRTDAIIRESGLAPWKLSLAEWERLSPRAKSGVPPWLPPLLNRFAFCGVEFELPHPDSERGYDLLFEFFDPRSYEREVVGWIADLPPFGFYAFAGEADGNLWIGSAEKGASADIYLLESSDWNGDQPTPENGLIHASASLAALLPRLSVSNVFDRNA